MRSSRCTTFRNNARKTHPLARTQDITIRATTAAKETPTLKASGITRSAKTTMSVVYVVKKGKGREAFGIGVMSGYFVSSASQL